VELLLASISRAELGHRLCELGFDAAAAEATLSAYQLLFSEVAPVDAAVARAAFLIGCRTPRRLPLADALVAATAQAGEAVLVHRDEHMRLIPAELLDQKHLAAGSPERGS
jgi:predicted nucleic acid-binding protein